MDEIGPPLPVESIDDYEKNDNSTKNPEKSEKKTLTEKLRNLFSFN